MKSVEVIGKTKEEAISGALSRLDAVIDDVLVEVIEEGSRGFLGIGSKPFKVKVTKKTNPVKVAKDFLREIFVAIELSVDVKCDFLDEKNLEINLSGENMGVIIGKRGQTLDALQYLTSIIVNKNDDKFVNVTMNTEFYREKRKETLENLAMSLARKAKHLRKDIVLEPMNSSERRIIHSTLQNDKYVTTHSEGEGIYRYIIISPKEEYRNSYSGEYKKSYGGGYRGGYKEGRKEGYKESYSGKYDYKSGYKSYKTYSNKDYKSDYFKDDYKSDDDSGTATDVDYEIE